MDLDDRFGALRLFASLIVDSSWTHRGLILVGAPGGPPPRNTDNDIWSADINMTPDGKFLYMTERTGSPLGALAVDDATGKLSELSMVRQFGDALHSDTASLSGQ